jgi:uncharacterized protein YndB with AHSA1/START domain
MSEPDRGFTLTRMLAAPRERVFQAWTDPDHLGWFSSGLGHAREPIEVDLRVDGVWRQKMVVDQDTEYFTGGIYREIVPPERLVFTWGAYDGWPRIDPDHVEDGPVVTVTLNDLGDKTEMIFHLGLPDHLSDDRVREWFASGMTDGWNDTIDRLVASLAGIDEN